MGTIRIAEPQDESWLARLERHVSPDRLRLLLEQGCVYVLEDEGRPAGWLRYGYLWDTIPFLNLLFVLEEYRGREYGTRLTARWEEDRRREGFRYVMVSTQAGEPSQHFYRRLRYTDQGGVFPPEEPWELILMKAL